MTYFSKAVAETTRAGPLFMSLFLTAGCVTDIRYYEQLKCEPKDCGFSDEIFVSARTAALTEQPKKPTVPKDGAPTAVASNAPGPAGTYERFRRRAVIVDIISPNRHPANRIQRMHLTVAAPAGWRFDWLGGDGLQFRANTDFGSQSRSLEAGLNVLGEAGAGQASLSLKTSSGSQETLKREAIRSHFTLKDGKLDLYLNALFPQVTVEGRYVVDAMLEFTGPSYSLYTATLDPSATTAKVTVLKAGLLEVRGDAVSASGLPSDLAFSGTVTGSATIREVFRAGSTDNGLQRDFVRSVTETDDVASLKTEPVQALIEGFFDGRSHGARLSYLKTKNGVPLRVNLGAGDTDFCIVSEQTKDLFKITQAVTDKTTHIKVQNNKTPLPKSALPLEVALLNAEVLSQCASKKLH